MTLLRNNLRQVVHTLLPLSPSSIIWYQRKLGSKQAYHVVHQPVSPGLAVFADAWLLGWLAEISADLRETVAHQRWFHDDALYKSTTFFRPGDRILCELMMLKCNKDLMRMRVSGVTS